MSALTFTLKSTQAQRINCSILTPDNLAGKSVAEIAAIELMQGGQPILASDCFDISGSDTQQLRFKNSTHQLDYIGANMSTGSISIDGDAGAYLGSGMKSGTISCHGNSGDFTACSMRGGLLTINGDVGDFLGVGTEGSRKGMLGGTVIVKGNAGDRVGDQMRRGLILIEGSAGAFCGSRMIAGTIGVLGKVGPHVGFNMHRGSILLTQSPQLSLTMQDCGQHTLPFLKLLFKSFASLDTIFNQLHQDRVRRFVGDAACGGNGEILLLGA